MRRIKVYFDNTMDIWLWLQPLSWCKSELKKRGYYLEFDGIPQLNVICKCDIIKKLKSIKDEDIVFLVFHHKSVFCRIEYCIRKKIIENIKSQCNLLVWLDTSDSSGTCMFDVLPYVDKYLKKQLLKDRNLYLKELLGQRFFVDYYSKTYGMKACKRETVQSFVENDKDLSKLGVSWNIALWNNYRDSFKDRLFRIVGISCYNRKRFVNTGKKELIVFFNGSIPSEINAITYQRRKIIELISNCNDCRCIAPCQRFSRKKYVEYMKKSILIPSPYGWGEICNRDFEAFLYGGCLLKPSMNGIETFPDVYIENETYIPLKWDFSDFKDIISYVQTEKGEEEARQIAQKGQDIYKFFLGKNRDYLLAEHLAKVLESAKIY